MDNMSYILFICLAIPVMLMILPIEKKSRKIIIAMFVGMFCCLFVSEINGLLLNLTRTSKLYFTTNITPITEEIIKALPIAFYAAVFSSDRKSVITVAFAVGVGFAMLENLIILTQHIDSVNVLFALVRGFGSGLMHSICAVMLAFYIPYIHKNRKIFLIGTLCTFNFAVVFHAIFNLLVEADSTVANYIGYYLPLLAYSFINAIYSRMKKNGEPEN